MVKNKIAFLGLGIMGFAMASHLQKNNFDIKVWNRTKQKVINFGSKYLDLDEVIKDADFVISCLGKDDSVKEISQYILPKLKEGSVWIDHTTISSSLTCELYLQSKERKVSFLEAPVTGGSAGAEAGTLTTMCGGDFEIFNKSLPILQTYSQNIEFFGEIGNGQKAKMVNQICIAGVLQGLSEAIKFAQKSNLDTDKLFNLISNGSASSWQMKNRYQVMCSKDYKEDFGFPVEWIQKDLDICLKEASKIGLDLKFVNQINEKYKKLKEEGNKRYDASSIILLD